LLVLWIIADDLLHPAGFYCQAALFCSAVEEHSKSWWCGW